MWISADGRLNTAARPLESIEHLLPNLPRRVQLAEQLADFDLWREGGVGELVLDQSGEPPIDLEREAQFHAQTLPDHVLLGFDWQNINDVPSAEGELAKVPLRWRLDMALVIEDLIERTE